MGDKPRAGTEVEFSQAGMTHKALVPGLDVPGVIAAQVIQLGSPVLLSLLLEPSGGLDRYIVLVLVDVDRVRSG